MVFIVNTFFIDPFPQVQMVDQSIYRKAHRTTVPDMVAEKAPPPTTRTERLSSKRAPHSLSTSEKSLARRLLNPYRMIDKLHRSDMASSIKIFRQ